MPKRSLNPGNGPSNNDSKKIEQLNTAVEAMLSRKDGRPKKAVSGIEPLMRVAAELRNLPDASFKARLRSELTKSELTKSELTKPKGRNRMTTVAEPVAAVKTSSVHTSATPRLAFRDAAKAIEFYKTALGARETFRFATPTGIPQAEITIGDSKIMLTEEWPEGGRFSAETFGHSPVSMVIQVDDVDAFAKRAATAGMKITREPMNQFYGHRDVMMADPFGYAWSAYTVTEELSVGEMHRRMKGMTEGPEGGKMPVQSDKPKVNPIPAGHRMVTPYLVAADGVALLEFAKQGIGAQETMRAMTPTGVHSEVRIGDSAIMIGGGLAGVEFPSTLHPNALHVYVKDVDKVYKNALAAGATSITEPRDHEYGERGAGVKDKAGNLWYIATRLTGPYKWEGAPDVQPYLHPVRVEPVINFLKRAFGAEEVGPRYASPDGVVHHMTFKIGDSHLEMGEAQGPYQPMPAMFYLYVPDCDALYQRALAAGAKSLHLPTDQPYGDRNSAVTDAFGNTWYIATHVKDMS